MNRILTAVIVVGLAGTAAYLWMGHESPPEASGPGSEPAANEAGPATKPGDRTALENPDTAAQPKVSLERPPADRAPQGGTQPGAVGGVNAVTAVPVHDPSLPASLPADEEDRPDLVAKYARATPAERRQAIEDLGLLLKDAASGATKGREKEVRGLELEILWLEGHVDG